MRASIEYRVPEYSRELIKEIDENFPAPTPMEIASLEPRMLAFAAGARYVIDALLEMQKADDVEVSELQSKQGELNV